MNGGRGSAQEKETMNVADQAILEDVDVCGQLFDHIDELLDFSNDDIGGEEFGGADGIWTTNPDALTPSAASSHGGGSSRSNRSAEEDIAPLAFPSDELAELEWLSAFMDDSFVAGGLGSENGCCSDVGRESTAVEIIGSEREAVDSHSQSHFQALSPVSVLDSGEATFLTPGATVPVRARSKRPRPASFFRRIGLILSSAASEESQPLQETVGKKKRRRPAECDGGAARRCLHCGIQRTPQWRMGPMGPRTLCNACGVRYKSGRLYPEYRPAASPTFVAMLHSNSHKKVLEMRMETGQNTPAPAPEFVRKAKLRLLGCA